MNGEGRDSSREVSHFPLSANVVDSLKGRNGQEESEIGASKILSKSRSKLINKVKKYQENNSNHQ